MKQILSATVETLQFYSCTMYVQRAVINPIHREASIRSLLSAVGDLFWGTGKRMSMNPFQRRAAHGFWCVGSGKAIFHSSTNAESGQYVEHTHTYADGVHPQLFADVDCRTSGNWVKGSLRSIQLNCATIRDKTHVDKCSNACNLPAFCMIRRCTVNAWCAFRDVGCAPGHFGDGLSAEHAIQIGMKWDTAYFVCRKNNKKIDANHRDLLKFLSIVKLELTSAKASRCVGFFFSARLYICGLRKHKTWNTNRACNPYWTTILTFPFGAHLSILLYFIANQQKVKSCQW